MASPVTTFTTPGGSVDASSRVASRVESGACSGGLTTTVFPATSGAASFSIANRNGWLKGLTLPTTPYGCRSV